VKSDSVKLGLYVAYNNIKSIVIYTQISVDLIIIYSSCYIIFCLLNNIDIFLNIFAKIIKLLMTIRS